MNAETFSKQSGFDSGKQVPNCGLYLHIPFCLRKCLYCTFFSVPGKTAWYARYCQAAVHQMELFDLLGWTTECTISTIFFGGGTPSVFPPSLLSKLLQESQQRLNLQQGDIEISLEVNPATVGRGELSALIRAGFNRLSIGIQSFADNELQALGRPHTGADAREAFISARLAGFSNISVDLMYGLPGQDLSSWRQTLNQAFTLDPDHLSIYELNVEEGSVFAGLLQQGKLDLPDEEVLLDMMELAIEETARKGFGRYEISNYARQGKECRHNINYWQNGSYLGIGAGAVSCLAGRRFSTVADIEDFCRRIESADPAIGEIEELDIEARFRETVVMGLRMTAGVSVPVLEERFGLNPFAYYGALLEQLQHEGLLEISEDHIKLTRQGLMLANRVMAELV